MKRVPPLSEYLDSEYSRALAFVYAVRSICTTRERYGIGSREKLSNHKSRDPGQKGEKSSGALSIYIQDRSSSLYACMNADVPDASDSLPLLCRAPCIPAEHHPDDSTESKRLGPQLSPVLASPEADPSPPTGICPRPRREFLRW